MTEPIPSVSLPWMHIARPRRQPVRGIAVVLHGGRERSTMRTAPWQAAVIRLLPFDWALRRAGRRRGLAVVRIRFRVRGWNAGSPVGGAPAPVADLLAALDLLAARYPGAPIALVGHSMGGRAAMRGAGHPAVRAVVGLAPWIAFAEPYRQLADRDVLILHGTADRWTDPVASESYGDAAAQIGARVSYVAVEGGTHSMLQHPRFWHRVTADYVTAILPGLTPAPQSATGATANLVRDAVRGNLRTSISPA
ncbi:MAG: lysophospholipase [Pseudonocardiales bacterium]|nr:lysophospholipase [Pseudonocardiales bacterium]